MRSGGHGVQIKIRQFFARHHPRSDLGDGRSGRLGDKGHRTASAGIDLDDVDVLVLDGVLNIHQPDHVEAFCQQSSLAFDFRDHRLGQRVGRQGTGAVARMDARFLDMFHNARDEDFFTIANRIHVNFDRVFQKMVYKNRTVA